MTPSDYFQPRTGRYAAVARALGVSESLVMQWARGKPAPHERCPQIEQATQGAVTCEEMRADLSWMRVPDESWPWHPGGRPLFDPVETERRVACDVVSSG
ncbi:MAG: Cro/CI family transcriptional regulator [Aestuariivirga sp.]